jgi:hypothetical protein
VAQSVKNIGPSARSMLKSPGADQGTKHMFCLDVLKLTETEYLEALNKATNGGVVRSAWN